MLNSPFGFTIILSLLIFAIGIGLAIYSYSSSPKSQAELAKKMGMGWQYKRGMHIQLILALEDPEIRALLYDAMQEEARLRRERKS